MILDITFWIGSPEQVQRIKRIDIYPVSKISKEEDMIIEFYSGATTIIPLNKIKKASITND